MRLVWAAVATWLMPLSPMAVAQEEPVPLACRPQAGRVDFARSADASDPGSGVHRWALINLASQAFGERDFANAVRLYDEASAGGHSVISDPRFHAFRGSAYAHVGREQEALGDARLALAMLDGTYAWPDQRMAAFAAQVDREAVLVTILPILHDAGDAGASAAMAMLEALPMQDWVSSVNRAAVAIELGQPEQALRMNALALAEPTPHPAALNNQCMILTSLGRAAEGLAYCQAAVAGAPQVAAVHDSLADALVALGRCVEAEAALQSARRLDPASAHYQRTLACTSAG